MDIFESFTSTRGEQRQSRVMHARVLGGWQREEEERCQPVRRGQGDFCLLHTQPTARGVKAPAWVL